MLAALFILGLTIEHLTELSTKILLRVYDNIPAENGQLGGVIDRVIEALQRTSQSGFIAMSTEEFMTVLYSLICIGSIVLLTRSLPPRVYVRLRRFIHE